MTEPLMPPTPAELIVMVPPLRPESLELSSENPRGGFPDPLPKYTLRWHGWSNEGFFFAGVDLTGSKFSGNVMPGAEFFNCIANDVIFDEEYDKKDAIDTTNLRGAQLSGLTGLGSKFEGADLRGADLQKLIAHSTTPGTFTRDHVCFDGADLRGANLKQADIRGASFQWSGNRPAWLVGADLRGADASGANFTGAAMTSVYAIGANFEGANLTDATLVASRLERCNLRGANLTNADLRMANLEGADLTGAILDGALLPANLVNLASREPEPEPGTTEAGLLEAEPY